MQSLSLVAFFFHYPFSDLLELAFREATDNLSCTPSNKTSKLDSLYISRGYVPNDGGTLKFNLFAQTTCHALPNILVNFRLGKKSYYCTNQMYCNLWWRKYPPIFLI